MLVILGGFFLGPAFHAAFPRARYMRKPRLVTQTAFLCVVRAAYDGFRGKLLKAIGEEQQKAALEQGQGKHTDALTALNNLYYLLECHLPALHDYFSYLKVSLNRLLLCCVLFAFLTRFAFTLLIILLCVLVGRFVTARM